MARIIADEMAAGFHEVLGQSIASAADLNALLLAAEDKDVIHIDECHELLKPFQTALYLAVDQRKICLPSSGHGRIFHNLPLADFTLLLSTTDEYCLLQPLRDRMRLTLRFDFYSTDELCVLLRQRSHALQWEVDEDVFPMVAQRARGTPRLALRLLQSARRVSRAKGEITVTPENVWQACQLEQIDSLGLGPVEQQYISILHEGSSRLNVIASMLGLPTRTISQVTEPFLLRTGLVAKDERGRRALTAMGREHLSKSR